MLDLANEIVVLLFKVGALLGGKALGVAVELNLFIDVWVGDLELADLFTCLDDAAT